MRHGTANHRLYRTWIGLGVIAMLGTPSGDIAAASPGLPIGITSYDQQHNNAIGRQVAKNPSANTVHFCWTMWDHIPASVDDADRWVNYNSYDIATGTLNQGATGISVSWSYWARAGFCRIDTDSDNLTHMVLHQREIPDGEYRTWYLRFPLEGNGLYLDTILPPPVLIPDDRQMMWPDVAVEQNQGLKGADSDIIHIIAHPNYSSWTWEYGERLYYWRYDAGAATPLWQGPVILDSTRSLSYCIDADDNSNNVCLVYTSDYSTDGFNDVRNVAYRESITSGLGWINGVELGPTSKNHATSYSDAGGPRAWLETSVLYDHAGDLHILYTEQRAPVSEHLALKHWRKSRGISRLVAYAWYDSPGEHTTYDWGSVWRPVLNIAFISIGVGDGSTLCDGGGEDNSDYLYVVYGKLCGETPDEQADTSALGFCNTELYLSVSRDHGDFWSNPINLTNTKTPDCNPADPEVAGPGDCASEAWASLARNVDDLHILYIADRQAAAFDDAGWTINPVNYLRIPGGTTDDPYLCATPPPSYAASLDSNAGPCGVYELSSGEQNSTILRLYNTGPGPMTGTITGLYTDPSDPPGWLLIDGADTADYSVPSADSSTAVVTLTTAALAPGLYEGRVLVSHNDHLQANPDTFDIVLAVDWCPCLGVFECEGELGVLYVVKTVNVAFRGAPPEYDAFCTFATTDVDCNTVTDVLDVVRIVNVAFRSGDPATQFCHPCPP